MDNRTYEITDFPGNINVESSSVIAQGSSTSEYDIIPVHASTVDPSTANTAGTTEALYDTVASEDRVVEAAASTMLDGDTMRTKSEREKQAGNKPLTASLLSERHPESDPIYYVLESDDYENVKQ